MGVTPVLTKQMLIQQTPQGDATVRTVAKLANVSIAEVIREATARGLPLLLQEYDLTEGEVEMARREMFPGVAATPEGGARLGNSRRAPKATAAPATSNNSRSRARKPSA